MKLKPPINDSLNLQKITWKKIGTSKKIKINRMLNLSTDIFELFKVSQKLQGLYMYRFEKNLFFLKILDGQFFQNEKDSIEIINWLKNNNFSVNKSLRLFRDKTYKNCCLSVYDFYDGYFSSSTKSELRNFGESLAKLHFLFKKIPFKKIIKEKTKKKILTVSNYWNQLLTTNQKIVQNLKKIYPDIYKIDFANELSYKAQVIHGDLNHGNLLFKKDSINFLDFEDTSSSFYSPLVDVSFAIQRFILVRRIDCLKKSKYFLESYLSNGGCHFKDKDQLFRILISISIKSIANLLINEFKKESYKNEINKFTFLLEQACKDRSLLQKICLI